MKNTLIVLTTIVLTAAVCIGGVLILNKKLPPESMCYELVTSGNLPILYSKCSGVTWLLESETRNGARLIKGFRLIGVVRDKTTVKEKTN